MSKDKQTNWQRELGRIRQTVESIGIAVVLAFVLRAFTIEAFVIPTGSMAPRLLGAHWHIQCENCGYEFDYRWNQPTPPQGHTVARASGAVCPNCRRDLNGPKLPVAGGDRVLVLKFLYNFSAPQPWDVVVFRNPQNNVQNYIKRLIGVPGETIELIGGDVWVKVNDDAPWTIRRKPDYVQNVMWQLIYDKDYQAAERLPDDTTPEWVPDELSNAWSVEQHGRVFTFDVGEDTSGTLTFDAPVEAFLPSYGYNKPAAERGNPMFTKLISTDLMLSALFTPGDENSQVDLDMTVLEREFRGSVSADGTLKMLFRPTGSNGEWTVWGQTRLKKGLAVGQGRLIALANVDSQLQLLVDGQVVLRSTDEQYTPNREAVLDRMKQVEDARWSALTRITPPPKLSITASRGSTKLSHLKVQRDVYYTGCDLSEPPQNDAYARRHVRRDMAGWGTRGNPIRLQGDPDHPTDYDSFFVLGDNSPQSLDSRHWSCAAPTLRLKDENNRDIYQMGTVPRYQMIGKAVFVYWPSGYALPKPINKHLVPNVGNMRMVR
jgi:signal peptidase I